MKDSIDYFQACPGCNRTQRIRKDWSGQYVRCSHCSTPFRTCMGHKQDPAQVRFNFAKCPPVPECEQKNGICYSKPVCLSVLLVDDDREILHAMGEALTRSGLLVTGVHHPRMALEAIHVHPYSVAILDIRLPEMNGIELMQELRKFQPGLRTIILSGSSDSGLRSDILRDGAYAWLAKPCRLDQLRKAIDSAIGGESWQAETSSLQAHPALLASG